MSPVMMPEYSLGGRRTLGGSGEIARKGQTCSDQSLTPWMSFCLPPSCMERYSKENGCVAEDTRTERKSYAQGSSKGIQEGEGPAEGLGSSIALFVCLFCLLCCVILHFLFTLSESPLPYLCHRESNNGHEANRPMTGLHSLLCLDLCGPSTESLGGRTSPFSLVPSHFPRGTL